MKRRNIFISYSNVDLEQAQRVVNFLEQFDGLKCFVSYRDIPVGKVWAEAIADALEECKIMVSIYSENYNQSKQVDREIEVCCDVEGKPIITYKLSDTPMKGVKKMFLKNLNWIDATDDLEIHLPELYHAICQNISIEKDLSTINNTSHDRANDIFSNTISILNVDSDNFVCHLGRKITQDMIYQAVCIDQSVFSSEFQGIYETCINWWKKNPFIYVMIEDPTKKRIAGYINAMPLTNEYYHRIRSGETIDVDIPISEIETYDFPDTYKLYFSSIAIHPDYQSTSAFKTLFDAFIYQILHLYEREIYFSSIVADAVTPVGEKLCKYIGLAHTIDSNHGSKIYEGALIPPSIRPTTFWCKRLIAAYQHI